MTNVIRQRNKDTNITNDEELNLSCILNTIDGVLEQSGRILIITSNHPNMIDEALLRPGRIDMKVHFTKCDENMAISIINNIFNTNIKKIDMSREYSPAEIVNECFNVSNPNDLKL